MGSVPEADTAAPPRPDKAVVAERRAREKRLSAWRRKEAAARGVDEQVILPGHCLQDFVDQTVSISTRSRAFVEWERDASRAMAPSSPCSRRATGCGTRRSPAA